LAPSSATVPDADPSAKPKPLGIEGTYHFNYNRSAWISLFGSDVEAEMKKQIVRYIGLQFRRPGSQLEGQLKELHRQYWKAGELELLKVKKALTRTGKPVSGRLFLAVSLPFESRRAATVS
jgi:hypothetical protein